MMVKRLALAASIISAAFLVSSSIAAATPGPTPDQGLTGACNMANTNAQFGMFTIAANTPASGNGFNGMIVAIENSFPDWSLYYYCPAPQ
jgi:hypothetical protein